MATRKLNAIRKYDGTKVRYVKEDEGTYFVYGKGRSRYGWRYSEAEFNRSFEPIVPKKSEFEAWHGRMERAIAKMNKTGLWEGVRDIYENLLTVPEDVYNEVKSIDYFGSVDVAYAKYGADYPFLFVVRDDGTVRRNWECFNELAECRTKSMYFGKGRNKDVKAEIKDALARGEKFNPGRVRTNYDVSFEYNPDARKAWYSEEYKDCGNGHYYIAIDENTAIFCEND